jgi:predicted CXXCH cytochrome family protein
MTNGSFGPTLKLERAAVRSATILNTEGGQKMKTGNQIKVLVFCLSVVLAVTFLLPANAPGIQSSWKEQQGSLMFEKTTCKTCHVLDSGGKIVVGELTASVTVLCGRCHDDIFTKGYTHPVNMKPGNVLVPGDMPLSREGALNCCTCHDIHSSFLTPYGAHTYYLRRGEIGQNFCSICHSCRRSRSAGHKGTLGKAHLAYRHINTMSAASSRAIDPMSQDCISCHDGATATSIPIRVSTIAAVGSESMTNDMSNHPIGIDYETARVSRKRSMSDLRPMAMVDPRISFFDGKIGCGSCHDPYSTIENQLVKSDRGSALCFSCHLMDKGI